MKPKQAGPGERFSESSRFFDPEDQVSLRDLALVPWKRRGVVAACTAFLRGDGNSRLHLHASRDTKPLRLSS